MITAAEYRKLLQKKVSDGELPATELESYHVRFEKVDYDKRTGKKLSLPKLQKFTVREWGTNPSEGMQDYFRRMEMEYTVLYNPKNKKAADKKSAKDEPTDEEEK